MNRLLLALALALPFATTAYAQCGPGGCGVESIAAGNYSGNPNSCGCNCAACNCGSEQTYQHFGHAGHSIVAYHSGQPVRNVARGIVRAPFRVVAGTAHWFADHRPLRRVVGAPVRFLRERQPVRSFFRNGGVLRRGMFGGCAGCR